jgi:hypothetical protein
MRWQDPVQKIEFAHRSYFQHRQEPHQRLCCCNNALAVASWMWCATINLVHHQHHRQSHHHASLTNANAAHNVLCLHVGLGTCTQSDPEFVQAQAACEEARSKVCSMERELREAVDAPVSGHRDPTTWLPDELMLAILCSTSAEVVYGGVCGCVCRRWARLVKTVHFQRYKMAIKWSA